MKWIIKKMDCIIGCRDKDIYVVDLPFDQATITKIDTDLIIEMPAGHMIKFKGFYVKNVCFQVGDRILDPNEFFKSLNEKTFSISDNDDNIEIFGFLATPEDEELYEQYMSSWLDDDCEPYFNGDIDYDPFSSPEDDEMYSEILYTKQCMEEARNKYVA